MPLRYQHATAERPGYGDCTFRADPCRDRAPARPNPLTTRPFTLDDALTSQNEENQESSGGETRTLNLAVNSRLLCH